jgi:hypothetical protein
MSECAAGIWETPSAVDDPAELADEATSEAATPEAVELPEEEAADELLAAVADAVEVPEAVPEELATVPPTSLM